MSKIFISYRRADSAYISSYMYDELIRAFGRNNVFLDVDSIAGGIDYRQAIEQALDQCQVLVVMIGPQWLASRDEQSGLRRVEQPDDPVRLEIEGGLRRSNMLVLPLLVENARMPDAKDLPPSIAALSYRNAQQLRPGADLRTDMERIINTIAHTIPRVAVQPIGMPSTPGMSMYAPIPQLPIPQPVYTQPSPPLVSSPATKPTKPSRAWIPIVSVLVVLVLLLCGGGTFLVVRAIQGAANSISSNNPTATTGTSGTTNNPTNPPGAPDLTSQVLAAYNSFCQALHANQLDTAFSDLTPGYQQSVGSAANLPNAVGGTFGNLQETASNCSVFAPPNVQSGGQEAIELGSVVVSDSFNGTHTMARNFEFDLSNGKWLINNIYAQ